MIVDKTYTQDKTMQTVIERAAYYRACLLYTSDAADE